jgi:uncharacterized phiE125 gp8 family phage protein
MATPDYLLVRTGAASVAPVSVAEVKLDQRIEHDDDDSLLQGLIAAATEYAQEFVGKALIAQDWALSLRSAGRDGRISLPVTPVSALVSITYFDADNQAQSLNVSDFYLHGGEDWAYIEPVNGSWPAVYDRLDALTVTFTAGYGAAAEDVPSTIRQAIRLLVGHWYENRLAASDIVVQKIPFGADALLGLSRKGWVA